MKPFPTYFAYTVSKRPIGCAVLSCADTLQDALGQAFAYATFYAMPHGTTVAIEERCKECDGSGKIWPLRRRGPAKSKPCPACRGKAPGFRLEFIAMPHSNVEIRRGGEIIWHDDSPEGTARRAAELRAAG